MDGGCLCGALRYSVNGPARETVHCHCRLCQKSSGAGFLTWSTFAKEAVQYTEGSPAIFRSSQQAQREFCGRCGTQIAFRGDLYSTVDLTTASFEEPDLLTPTANTWVGSRRLWAHGFNASLQDYEGEIPGTEI